MAPLVRKVSDIEINGHVYTNKDWEEDTAGTISSLASDISRSLGQLGSSLSRIPDSPVGLPAGTVYHDDGVLKIADGEPVMTPNQMREIEGLPTNVESSLELMKRSSEPSPAEPGATPRPAPVEPGEEHLAPDEVAARPRWASVVGDTSCWRTRDPETQEPPRSHAPLPARALRSAPGVAPFLAFDE